MKGERRQKSRSRMELLDSPPEPVLTEDTSMAGSELSLPNLDAMIHYSPTGRTVGSLSDSVTILNRGVKAMVSISDAQVMAPDSLIAQLNSQSSFFDPALQVYLFHRNTTVFESILDFYNTGVLHLPKTVCAQACIQELGFWQISLEYLCPTCRNNYHECKTRELMEAELEKQLRPPPVPEVTFRKSCRYRMWRFLEKPNSSCAARLYAFIIYLSILCSVALLVLETIPRLRFIPIEYSNKAVNASEDLLEFLKYSQAHFALDLAELVCTMLAMFDMVLRFIVSYDKVSYFKDPINLADLLYIFPSIAGVVVNRLHLLPELGDPWSSILRVLLMLARTLRVFRLFWIARHYKPLKVMLMAVKSSIPDLALMSVAVFILLGVFSILMYNCEASAATFPDMLVAVWWAVITMTTVGYGDYYPITLPGKIVAAFCALTGIMLIAMVIPIVSNHFFVLHQASRHIIDKIAMESRLQKTFRKVKEQGQKLKVKSTEAAKKLLRKNNEVAPVPETEPIKDWYM